MKNIIIITLLLSLTFVYADLKELQELQTILNATRGSWTAAENEFSMLPAAEQQKMMGLLPGVYNPNLLNVAENVGEVRIDRAELLDTSIKNQASCGSCYAHGACAAYEGWKLNGQGQTYDLSEQWFMMKAKEIGPYGGCSGWYLDTSMNLLKNYGTANESDCKYLGYEQACASGIALPHRISSWSSTTTKENIQAAINAGKPVYVGFAVYQDFSYYAGGYYEYKSGSLRGYHAVCVVGYDATGFKVKNSWGSGWGEAGYFRILYSQMTNSVQFGTCFGGSFYINN
jgi:C1A family cysteine protease